MKRKLILAAWVALAPACCYHQASRFALVWDDRELVASSPVVTGDMPAWRAFDPSFWVHHDLSKGDAYRPLVKLSYLASRRLGRGGAAYHRHSLWIHCASAALFYWLLLACGCTPMAAALAGLIAGCHPIQSETVLWVKNRAELMCVHFGLWAVLGLAHLRGRGGGARPWLVAAGCVAAYGAALLSKSSAVVFAPFLVVAAWWLGGKPGRAAAIGLVLVLVGYVLVRPSADTVLAPVGAKAIATRLSMYARSVLWPVGQSAHHVEWIGAGWAIAVGLVGLAGVAAAARGRRWAVVCAAAGLVLLAPAVAGPLALRPVAEQRVYAALFALAACVGPALARGRRAAIAAALVCVLCVLAVHRSFVWRDDAHLWRDTVIASGPRARPLTNLGLTLKAAGRRRDALWAFARAARLDAGDINPLYNAGVCCLELRDWPGAAAWLGRVVALEPHGPAYAGLALAHAHQGDLAAGRRAASRAVELAPDSKLVRDVAAFVFGKEPARQGD